MSFAQGLSSGFAMGTQLGNTIQDRRYTRDLAALQEQYKAQQAELQAPTPGAGQAAQEGVVDMPGVGLAIPGGAPVAQGQQVFDAAQQQRAAPAMSAMDLYQAQRGLAAKYNRVDELRRLDGLIAQQEQFSAQQADRNRQYMLEEDRFNEQKRQFNAQQQANAQRDAIGQNQWAATFYGNQIRQAKQDAVASATRQAEALANNLAFGGASFSEVEAVTKDLEPDARAAFESTFYPNYINKLGIKPEEFNLYKDAAIAPLRTLQQVSGAGVIDGVDAEVATLNQLVTKYFDPNVFDDVTPEFARREDGTIALYEGNKELATGPNAAHFANQYVSNFDADPMRGVAMFAINEKRRVNAAASKLEAAMKKTELNVEQQKLAVDLYKALANDPTFLRMKPNEREKALNDAYKSNGINLDPSVIGSVTGGTGGISTQPTGNGNGNGNGQSITSFDLDLSVQNRREQLQADIDNLNKQSGGIAQRADNLSKIEALESQLNSLESNSVAGYRERLMQAIESGEITAEQLSSLLGSGRLSELEQRAATGVIRSGRLSREEEVAALANLERYRLNRSR